MKISVIIPVYKVEQFLNACVKSVVSQTYKDVEIILVDDGSPDNCPAMCDSYAIQDKRIKVVHKVNGGLSDARNAGLKVATGDYVIFLDSDDYWLDKNFVDSLCINANENQLPDIVLFGRVDYYEASNKYIQGNTLDISKIQGKTRNEVFGYLLYNQLFNMSACFLMIKRSLIIENNIFFEKGLLGEDMDWSLKLWSNVNSVAAINNFAYCYRHRPASITTSYTLRNVSDFVFIMNKWINIAQNEIKDKEYSRLVLGYLAFLYPTLLRNFYYVGRLERENEYALLKTLFPILKYSVTNKSNQVIKLEKKVGFRFTCMIFGVFGLIKKRGWGSLKLVFSK